MALIDKKITNDYALYNGECVEVCSSFKDDSIDLSVYSPPFAGLYNYSSSPEDMSNCKDTEQFMRHYEFLVEQMARITKPGRHTVVHAMDTPTLGHALFDFPGAIIRLHEKHGFYYVARYAIWKEPLAVAIRTRALGLTHRQLVKDSSFCGNAGADYVLAFRKRGVNKVPLSKPEGLLRYAGDRELPESFKTPDGKILPRSVFEKDWKDPQTNKLAHWIWQQYASSIWDDIRINRVLPYRAARDPDDEKHCHPLQLDVIDRAVTLWSNSGETVLTPFMGVGSEVYGALQLERRGIGIELKFSYYRQAVKNVAMAKSILASEDDQHLFEFAEPDEEIGQ